MFQYKFTSKLSKALLKERLIPKLKRVVIKEGYL
jgi:hypothetical protein